MSALDPQILIDAIRALRAAEAEGSKTPMKDACAAMIAATGRDIPRGTFRRWIHTARSQGLLPTLDGSDPEGIQSKHRKERGLISYQWSDLEEDGWTRGSHRPTRTHVEPKDKSDGLRITRFEDPGAMYPPTWAGPIATDKPKVRPLDRNPGGRGWILTMAQNETPVHGPFWLNLKAYAAAMGYPILVGGTTYAKSLFERFVSGEKDVEEERVESWSSMIEPYVTREQHDLGGVLYCAQMNTIPTATRPLSGLENFGKGKWTVFPHPKVQLSSVPRPSHKGPVFATTTGACTVPRYVQRKAGIKAKFHHIIGAVILEIDAEGTPFIRHVNADLQTGAFYDLDVFVDRGQISTGHRAEGITWGDIHHEQLDEKVAAVNWGTGGIFDTLYPKHQFVHDLLDFRRRNHHNVADPMHAVRMHYAGTFDVENEVAACGSFLASIKRDWCETVVVESNHDTALARWLREADWRHDPANARYWLEMNLRQVEAVAANDNDFNVFRHALEQCGDTILDGVTFVGEDDSYEIVGVECGMHGHLGPNGSRGSPMGLNKMSMRLNVGHQHSPSIVDGVYTAGLSGKLDQGYNKGPTAWAHSHIITYPNGKRTLVTILDGKWRAGAPAVEIERMAA